MSKSKEKNLFLNRYLCTDCDEEWEDTWSCCCNDKCPKCNKEIEPYSSEWMGEPIDNDNNNEDIKLNIEVEFFNPKYPSDSKYNVKEIRYFYKGKLHNPNGPAVIRYYYNGKIEYQKHYLNGLLHYDNGPAIVHYYKSGRTKSESYYINGKSLYIIKHTNIT